MNITLLVNRDLASNLALNNLLPRLHQHRVHVFYSARVGSNPAKTSEKPQALIDLAFMEQGLFNQLLSPLLTAKHGTDSPAMKSFDALSHYTAAPIVPLNNPNVAEGLTVLERSQPDLVISIRYGAILRQQAIDLPRHGIINLHSGLLPSYRGVMATFRAMANGDAVIGTTLHYIDSPSIDTGDIIATTQEPVDPARSYLWHVLSLYPAGCDRIMDAVNALSQGLELESQPPAGAGNYYGFPDQPALDEFVARGLKLFDGDEMPVIYRQFLPDD